MLLKTFALEGGVGRAELGVGAGLVVPAEETAPWKTVVLHLETATLVDSMGLNLIVKIYKAARLAGARVRVVCANPDVQRTLTFTRLDHQVELVRI